MATVLLDPPATALRIHQKRLLGSLSKSPGLFDPVVCMPDESSSTAEAQPCDLSEYQYEYNLRYVQPTGCSRDLHFEYVSSCKWWWTWRKRA